MECKTNKSRLIMVTLFIVALFMLYPSRIVKASDYYNLWVGETQVSSDNAGNILGNGTASYNPDTNTLTLEGSNITSSYSKNGNTYGIYSELDSLTVSGYGSISSITNSSIGIGSNQNNATLTVNGTGTGINISTVACGICTNYQSETLNLKGKITTEATGGSSRGIFSAGTVNIVDGTLFAKGSWGIETGFFSDGSKDINIGANVTKVTATIYREDSVYYPLRTFGNININPALAITTPAGGYVGMGDSNTKVILASDGSYPKTVVIEPVGNNNNGNNNNNTNNNNDTDNSHNSDTTNNETTKPATIPSFRLNTSSVVIQKGKTLKTVKATLTNDEIKSVESANSKIATVSYSGTTLSIKGIKKGSTKITVTTKSGLSCKLNVKVQTGEVKTTKLKVSKKSVNLASKGSIATVKATASPDYVSTKEKITVKSSNKKIATAKIDQETGEITITAKKKGSCKITVKAGKKTVTIKVKVKK
ncbi:Ig-like domain-containing protein [Butyrivibrio sp. MB2005]|uniref:Ig-like domain-containing protein n=1 Tax=Butyrivibrio sp. MB2005 TaxID=1280678 RepID=UPI0004223B88|nr:Ig-like domain-containing protein [Butyrivibrio sp. MB2005]